MLWIGVLLPTAGCGDLETGPPVQLRGEDPIVSLHFSDRLPTFPALVEDWGGGLGLESMAEAWRDSWERDPDPAARERREIVEVGAAVLADALPRSSIDQAFRQVDEAIRGAEAALGASLAPDSTPAALKGLASPLVEAARHRDLASEARTAGDVEAQLRHTLLASDRLRATTADALALVFIEQASVELRRISDSDPYPSMTRQRAERLLDGAREALDTGNPTLALQRAWYAAGLLRAPGAMDGVPDHEKQENR
jgi:hypothetical protein